MFLFFIFLVTYLTEQHFFEKVKQLAQCQEEFLSQSQEHLKLKDEFTKLGKRMNLWVNVVFGA